MRGALPPEPGWPVDAPVTGTGALAALRPRHLLGQSLIEQSVNKHLPRIKRYRSPCVLVLPPGTEGRAGTRVREGILDTEEGYEVRQTE